MFFFQAEDGIRDRSPSVGSEMCIRDRYVTHNIIAVIYAGDKLRVFTVEIVNSKENCVNSVVKHVLHQRN